MQKKMQQIKNLKGQIMLQKCKIEIYNMFYLLNLLLRLK